MKRVPPQERDDNGEPKLWHLLHPPFSPSPRIMAPFVVSGMVQEEERPLLSLPLSPAPKAFFSSFLHFFKKERFYCLEGFGREGRRKRELAESFPLLSHSDSSRCHVLGTYSSMWESKCCVG